MLTEPKSAAEAGEPVQVEIIVNGEPCLVAITSTLNAAVNDAITKTRNTGRPIDEWELRMESGEIIKAWGYSADAYGFSPMQRLFLTLTIGYGGES